jgi:protein-disulfide isomerase/transcription elongation factor Elf1
MASTDCPICGDDFTTETGLRDHTWDVHEACHHCGETFDEQHELYTHWLETHEGELSRETRKHAETTVGDRTVCPSCGKRFGDVSAVRDHAWDAHGVCHRCGDTFDEKAGLHAHWLAIHGDDLSRSERSRAESTVADLTFSNRLTHQGPVGALTSASVSRRTLLGGGIIGLGAVLGGGIGTGAFSGGGNNGPGLGSHPAATALGNQPTLGPPPGEADGTIIAFEDPSCPSCARFELNTFPELKSRLIETGDVSFVFRSIPVINPWGEPATLALEAVQARDEATFWGLKRYYYENQRGIDSENVYEATRSYLTEQTDLDSDAIVQDARQGTYREDVNTNLDASDQAGVRGTPMFFLFKSGSFATSFVGPQSYSVFANTLGV